MIENGSVSRRTFLMAAGAMAIARPAAAASAGTPILAYHRFDAARAGPTAVTTATFELQLRSLARLGFDVVPLRDAVARLQAPQRDGARQAAITVDDGHRSVHTLLFPLIRRLKLPVTLFIYPSAISNAAYAMTWEQLREMRASGLVDVQSHTYWHPNFATERRRRTPAAFAAFVDDQLQRSRRTIEARLGGRVDMLAWPFGIVDPMLEEAARRAGYSAALAYEGGPASAGADPFALPRIPVGEADRGSAFARKLGLAAREPTQ